ncbi:MAG: PEP-CTERM sorting domain-containing protein [Phycisphaerae bacterium]|nr:PEP-CTERM sorting domain-containing protein [Phycisphaerae bacterium]
MTIVCRFMAPLLVVAGLGALAASAGTIATFADPAMDGTTPLFELDGTTFSGGWDNDGMTLETPGLPSPDYDDAKMSMDDLTATPVIPGVWVLSGGTIEFTDSLDNPVLQIDFLSATLTSEIGFGASNLYAENVNFTVPGSPLSFSQERFAFSFANDAQTQNGFTWTASFTSSATVVPEPGSLGLLLAGGLAVSRGRRRVAA